MRGPFGVRKFLLLFIIIIIIIIIMIFLFPWVKATVGQKA